MPRCRSPSSAARACSSRRSRRRCSTAAPTSRCTARRTCRPRCRRSSALVAFPERADPRDALVARERGVTLATLRVGARVGTGSVRRAAQLRARRPDLEIVPLRGNVPTRLRKLASEGLDAVVLACAGLERLGLGERIDERIAPEILLPAVGQGVLAHRGAPRRRAGARSRSDHPPATAERVAAERAVLVRLGADCNVPLAAYAELTARGTLRLRAPCSPRAMARASCAPKWKDRPRRPPRLGVRAAEADPAGRRARHCSRGCAPRPSRERGPGRLCPSGRRRAGRSRPDHRARRAGAARSRRGGLRRAGVPGAARPRAAGRPADRRRKARPRPSRRAARRRSRRCFWSWRARGAGWCG